MADFSVLQSQILGKVVLQSDHGYAFEVSKVWNGLLRSKKPQAFVKVKGKDDVVETVKFCIENKLDMCVSGGATSDFAIEDDSVIVDLSLMRGVIVDTENKTAVVEGGARICDVDSVTCKHGFVIPLGSYNSALGVAGMTLIGGLGFLTRSYGVTSDNVLEFELVTASGDVIEASEEENPDLFWGMKGSGSNFGIVTSIKFQLHHMPHWVVGGTLHYRISRAEEVLRAVRDFQNERAEHRLCIYMLLLVRATGPELVMRLMFHGPLTEGGKLVQDLNDLTRPFKNDVGPVHHDRFQTEGDWLISPGRFYSGTMGHFLKDLNDEVIKNLVDYLVNKMPGTNKELAESTIYMTSVGGKANEIPSDSSSFPFRDASYWISMEGSTASEEKYEAMKDWVDTIQEVNAEYGLAPFGGDAEEANEKLKQLKQQYDPENVFNHNCLNINPE